MSNLLFGCDVDLTVVQSDLSWRDYLFNLASLTDQQNFLDLKHDVNSFDRKLPYNLGQLFPSVSNPMDYWKDLDYDQFEPIEGSIEALERISKYFGIVFISHIEGGDHGKTKCKWLKKHYPFLSGIVYTRQKWVMQNSVVGMLDDRLSHLSKFDFNKRYLFNTCYTQDVDVPVLQVINDWSEIDERFVRELIEIDKGC